MATSVYLFSKDTYLRYGRLEDAVEPGSTPPKSIAENWNGLREVGFGDGFDTAVNWGNGKLFFFRGGDYVRYDIDADRVDTVRRPIAEGWNGLASAGFGSDLDSVIVWDSAVAYFFKGDHFLQFDVRNDRVVGPAKKIADHWTKFAEAGFGSDLDAAIVWGNGKAYFFKDDKYIRVTMSSRTIDDGFPLPIGPNWSGLADTTFSTKIVATLDLVDLTHEIWVADIEQVKSPVQGPAFVGTPWRGVLHTTEGSSVESAINAFKPHNIWPHFTIDLNSKRVVQHMSLHRGARSLSDNGVLANAANAIQIEIVGFAKDSPARLAEELAALSELIGSIEQLVPIQHSTNVRFLTGGGVSANPANRMTPDAWKWYSGWCGHQHVPGENHWDPGAMDIEQILSPAS